MQRFFLNGVDDQYSTTLLKLNVVLKKYYEIATFDNNLFKLTVTFSWFKMGTNKYKLRGTLSLPPLSIN